MRRRFLVAGLAAAALSVAACSHSTGNQFNTGNVSQLVPGQTTLDQAIAMLGKPVSYEEVPQGRVVMWFHSHQTVTGLPGVNGGHFNGLKVAFDKSNVMIKVVKQMNIESGTIDHGD